MILGILRETKKGENRVICTPKEVETITSRRTHRLCTARLRRTSRFFG